MKKAISTADLATKVCKRGHIGDYILRSNGSSACKSCVRISVVRYNRGTNEIKRERLIEDSQERLTDLEKRIQGLKVELELSETEYEFLKKRLAILETTK